MLGIILTSCALNYMFIVIKIFYKLQHQFTQQNARLIARHFIAMDLCINSNSVSICKAGDKHCSILLPTAINSLISQKSIKPESDIFILNSDQKNILYYIRKSAVPQNHGKYALYRDDVVHNAVALVENIQDLQVNINNLDLNSVRVTTRVIFDYGKNTEVSCIINSK